MRVLLGAPCRGAARANSLREEVNDMGISETVVANPLEILLVEDDPGDVLLTREALKNDCVRHRLHAVGNGVEALDFLRNQGDFQDAPLPDLILMDLNLPRMDGRQLLAEIKRDERLRPIPVVVLTTSCNEKDIKACYALQASCLIQKPLDFGEFTTMMNSFRDFWLRIVKLPPR